MSLEIISYSEIETFRQCPLKHQLSYIERWRTDEEAEALARGTLFHSVMEAHYKEIKAVHDRDDTMDTGPVCWNAVKHLLYDPETGEQTDRQELVEWMYRGYLDLYGRERDWEIVGVEYPLTHPLLWPDKTESGLALSGTVDLLVKDRKLRNGLFIVDHKTCKDLPKQKDFDMEDQTAIYTHLLKQSGVDVRGAWYNHCRTYKLKTREMVMEERFKRTLTVRTDDELERMAVEALEVMSEAYRNHERRSFSTDDIPLVYDAPRYPDGERCGWKCGFTEACLAGRKYGPERTRTFLGDTGFVQHETKPGPTFNKKRSN